MNTETETLEFRDKCKQLFVFINRKSHMLNNLQFSPPALSRSGPTAAYSWWLSQRHVVSCWSKTPLNGINVLGWGGGDGRFWATAPPLHPLLSFACPAPPSFQLAWVQLSLFLTWCTLMGCMVTTSTIAFATPLISRFVARASNQTTFLDFCVSMYVCPLTHRGAHAFNSTWRPG